MDQKEMRQFADEPFDFSRLGPSAAFKIPHPLAELVESPALPSQHVPLQAIPQEVLLRREVVDPHRVRLKLDLRIPCDGLHSSRVPVICRQLSRGAAAL